MGFLGKLFGATVKTVLTPVTIVKDVVDLVSGETPDATSSLLEDIVVDVIDATEDLSEGEIL